MLFGWTDNISYLQCLVELEKIHPGKYQERIERLLNEIEKPQISPCAADEVIAFTPIKKTGPFERLRKFGRGAPSPSEKLKQEKPSRALR